MTTDQHMAHHTTNPSSLAVRCSKLLLKRANHFHLACQEQVELPLVLLKCLHRSELRDVQEWSTHLLGRKRRRVQQHAKVHFLLAQLRHLEHLLLMQCADLRKARLGLGEDRQ